MAKYHVTFEVEADNAQDAIELTSIPGGRAVSVIRADESKSDSDYRTFADPPTETSPHLMRKIFGGSDA